MRLLIASITNAPAEVLSAHLKTIRSQVLPEGWQADRFYLTDPSATHCAEILDEHGIRHAPAGPKPAGAHHAVTEETHEWEVPTFAWLAHEKQKLLDRALTEGYDAIFLCDSDLLLSPDTISTLILDEKPIVSGVFWTRWTQDQPPLPQVWLRHPYALDGRGLAAHEFLEALGNRGLVRVGGLGACTLIRREALERGAAFWPLIDGLPQGGMWQGEDRHFCVRAQRAHIELWADGWPDIFHAYRPSDVKKIPDFFERQPEPLKCASIGDLVSATLEPLEEPALIDLKRSVRGRLGTLPVLPDIERALAEMHVGEARLLSVRFPIWSPVEPYRGADRLLRVTLLGAKPFSYAPTLADASLASDRPVLRVSEPAMDDALQMG